MDSRELEQKLEQTLKQDFSAGTEVFRDSLLARCLKVLSGADDADGSEDREFEIPDKDLEMLAAAGDPYLQFQDNSN